MALVLSLTCVLSMTTNLAYAAPESNDIAYGWKPTAQGSGKNMLPYDQFLTEFTSSITTKYNTIMNGMTDSGGRSYYGLDHTDPSALMVAEYFAYMLIDCWWADHNMLHNDDEHKQYNLFHSTKEGLEQFAYSDVCTKMTTLKKGIQEKFPEQTNPWQGEFKNELYNIFDGYNFDTAGVFKEFSSTTNSSLKPGSGRYQAVVQGIVCGYLQTQIAGILAEEYLTEEEITAALSTGTGSDSTRVLQAVEKKAKDGTIFNTQPETGEGVEGEGTEGEGGTGGALEGAVNGAGSGADVGGETVVDPAPPSDTTEYKWPEQFNYNTSLIIGDSAVIQMALDRGWISEWPVEEGATGAELAVEPSASHPGIIAADAREKFAAGTNSPQLVEIINGVPSSNSELFDKLYGFTEDEENNITDIYILYGNDRALCGVDDDYADAMDTELYNGLGAISNFNTFKETPHVTIISLPKMGSESDYTAEFDGMTYSGATATQRIDDWNLKAPEWYQGEKIPTTFNEVYTRFLVANGSYSDLDAFWETFEREHAAAVETDENQATSPVGTTDRGNDATTLYNLYKANEDKLRPYFAAYNNILEYVSKRNSYGFADDSDGYVAYYLEMNLQIFSLCDFAMDVNEQGYKQSDNYKDPQPPLNPGDQVPDSERYDSILHPIELISNAKYENGKIVIPDKELKDAALTIEGYVSLAAGVVYDPFVSVAGNEAYFSTVRYMLDGVEEGQLEKVERLLHEAYTRKKPLYVLDGAKSNWATMDTLETAPSGDYRYARLSDVLQSTENVTRIYTVVAGGMEPSSVDASTWEYSVGKDANKGADTNGVTTGEGTVSGEVTDNGAYIERASDKMTVVAGATMVASSTEMSRPVMFTSGAKTAMFTGNWDGAASGYAASLGGLTTMVIHNAAQDAKDNPAVKNPEDYLLFMNGLGDIVLDDGTIILPAIANPAIYNYDAINYSVDATWSIEGAIGTAIGTTLGIAGGVIAPVSTGGAALVVVIGVRAVAGVAGGAAGASLGNLADAYTEGDSHEAMLEVYDKTQAYYPYTAAFMNHYPSVIVNTGGKLAVTNTNDAGKFVVGIDENANILARPIAGLNNKTQVNLEYAGGGITVAPIQGLSFDVTDNSRHVGTALPYVSGQDGTWQTRNFNTARKFEYFMVKDTLYSGDDQAFFPLNDDIADLEDSYLKLAGGLVTSAERFLMERVAQGNVTKAHDTFNVERYVVDMCGQGLMGTQYSETLQKNYQISYDEMVQDTGNRLLTFFVQLVESAVETLGRIDGVLAIKNGYENKFFNMIVQFIQEFYLLIAVALLAIVAIKFLKGHYNFIFVLFIGALCFCGFEVYANWMPTVVPSIYNFAVNDAVEQIAWNTVTVSAESYEETYLDSNRKDATSGALKPYTATLTLYKMSQTDMESVAGSLGTTTQAIKSGEVYYLDESAGIFIQGDAIKLSVDKLLTNNTMRGLYHTQWEELSAGITSSDDFITPVTDESDKIENPYSIQLTQPYVSLEAYYMPYNEIERAFMVNLNAFASVFRFERNQFNYSKNLYKDAFLFNCYTNSGIFTQPGVREVLRENIRVGSVLGGYDYGTDEDNVEMLLNRIYGNETFDPLFAYPEDWLNVAAVFRSPSANMKESLWGKMLQKRGWYNEDWDITDAEALGDLVAYINSQTKQFVINNSSQLNFCSDENAIKITSLYATTCFTHYVSQFGDWLYPNYLNAADIELRDVLYGSMTTLKERNIARDSSVVSTVAHRLGIFGVLFLLLITLFATVFVFTVTYLVPILYALLGLIIIYKLINDQNSLGLVQGYLKITGVTCLIYFIFSLSLRLVEVGGYAWYGYLGCALIMYLCCYFLFWVCLSVVQNIGEMGNDVLGQNLLRGLDHITRGAVKKLSTNVLNARRGFQGYGYNRYGYQGYGSPYQYGRGYGIDSRDYIRGSRAGYALGRGRRDWDEPGYSGYGRGASYDYGMYGREERRGSFGVVRGVFNRFTSRGRGEEAGKVRTSGVRSGMSRYTQSSETNHTSRDNR